MRKILFILNPTAGAKKLKITPDLINSFFSDTDIEITCIYSEYPGHASVLTQEYLDQGITDVVAIGGDGSINDIAKVLVGSSVRLGIIPTGSGNGIARHLGIPCHCTRSIEIIKDGHSQHIDAGLMNDQYFFSNSGLGLDASIIAHYDRIPHRGWLTYARLGVIEYFKYKKKSYQVALPMEEPKVYQPALVSVAISNQYGYNFKIAPDASMSDGEFELQIMPMLGPIYAVLFAWRMMIGKYFNHKKVKRKKCKELDVTFDGSRTIQCDGEPIQVNGHIKYKIVPNALQVILPENRKGKI